MSDKSIIVRQKMFKVPSEDQITEVESLSGKNPLLENIKNNPNWSGQKIIILDAQFHKGTQANPETGEISDYYICPALVYPDGVQPNAEEHGHLLSIGASNIFARISDAVTERAFPIRGTLRKSGRAWFID